MARAPTRPESALLPGAVLPHMYSTEHHKLARFFFHASFCIPEYDQRVCVFGAQGQRQKRCERRRLGRLMSEPSLNQGPQEEVSKLKW